MNDQELKLKPCPFCGEAEDLYATEHEVFCGGCGARTGSMCKTKEINAEIWNKRNDRNSSGPIRPAGAGTQSQSG